MIAQSPPRPNKLYRNRGDGTFEDVTERAGVAGRGYGMGCAVGDFDNDGHDDLFVTGLNQTILYRNRGDGTFEDVTRTCRRLLVALDDRGGFRRPRRRRRPRPGGRHLRRSRSREDVRECRDEFGKPIHCPPDRFPAQLDHLFRNNGDGTFTDVSREAGIEVPDGRGLGLAIADLDGDGRLDLFVANDGTANFLFRNLGGLRFEEVGVTAGVAYDGTGQATASMGVVAEDLNGDGRIDLFHTNFINQTNTLRWNLGGGLFADGTLAANLAAPSRSKTGFGTVALRRRQRRTARPLRRQRPHRRPALVQHPDGPDRPAVPGPERGRFELASAEASPYFSRPVVGRGVAAGDLDNDGRSDLVVVHRDAPAVLLRNVTRSGHWLGLRLRGTRSGRSPVGARVTCRAGGRTVVRWLTSGTGYLSSSDPRLWFGLGTARSVERLEVRWPSGTVQSWSDLAAGSHPRPPGGGGPYRIPGPAPVRRARRLGWLARIDRASRPVTRPPESEVSPTSASGPRLLSRRRSPHHRCSMLSLPGLAPWQVRDISTFLDFFVDLILVAGLSYPAWKDGCLHLSLIFSTSPSPCSSVVMLSAVAEFLELQCQSERLSPDRTIERPRVQSR